MPRMPIEQITWKQFLRYLGSLLRKDWVARLEGGSICLYFKKNGRFEKNSYSPLTAVAMDQWGYQYDTYGVGAIYAAESIGLKVDPKSLEGEAKRRDMLRVLKLTESKPKKEVA